MFERILKEKIINIFVNFRDIIRISIIILFNINMKGFSSI